MNQRNKKGQFVKGHILGFKQKYVPWNKGKSYKINMTEAGKLRVIKNLGNGMKGKKLTEKHKRILSESKKGDKNPMFGIHRFREDAPYWKGGISKINHLLRSRLRRNLQKSVFERDNYECCCCLDKENLHLHHIIPISQDKSQMFEIKNLMTLCASCHMELHKKI